MNLLVDRRARAQGGQGGYVLMLVLGAIGLTSVVVVALLGLALTSSRVTVSQREAAREQRAAAGALEAAIGQFVDNDPTEPCGALPDPATAPARIALEPGADGASRTVEVECWNEELVPALPEAEATQPTLTSRTPAVDASGKFRFATATIFDTDRSFTTRWSTTGTKPLRSAQLLFQSYEGEFVHNLNRDLIVTVNAPSVGSCSVTERGGRTNDWPDAYTAVDLLRSAACQNLFAGRTEAVFEGATVTVVHRYIQGEGCPFLLCAAQLTIGDVKLRTNVDVLQASSATAGSGWSDTTRILALDGNAASIPQSQCTTFGTENRCRRTTSGQSYTINLSGFDTLPTTLAPGDYVGSLAVVLESPTQNHNSGVPARSWISDPGDLTSFEVGLTIGGESCAVELGGFARSNQRLHVDLFGKSECREMVQRVEDLSGARLTYTVVTDCARYAAGTVAPKDASNRCDSVRLPEFDRMALAVTTLPLPRESIVTLNASIDGRVVAQADVYFDGKPAPRATPVVSWRYQDFTTRPPDPATP